MGAPFLLLAAAAIVVAAAIIAAAVAAGKHVTAAAVAQQQDQNDDPANITAAETVIVTHNYYLQKFHQRSYRSFQDIPAGKFGAKMPEANLNGCRCLCHRAVCGILGKNRREYRYEDRSKRLPAWTELQVQRRQ